MECPEYLRTERGLSAYNEAERQRVEQLRRIANHDIINIRYHPGGDAAAANPQDNAQQPEGENAAAEPIPPPRPPRPHFLGEGRNVFRFVNRHFFPNLHENAGENVIRFINRAELDPAAAAAANQPAEQQQPNNNNEAPADAEAAAAAAAAGGHEEPARPPAPLALLPPLPENPEIRQRHVRIVYNRHNIIRIVNHPERNNNVENNNNEQQQNHQPIGRLPVEVAYQQIFEAGNRDRVENGPIGGAAQADGPAQGEPRPAVAAAAAAAAVANGPVEGDDNANGHENENGENGERPAVVAAAAAADGRDPPPQPQEDVNGRCIAY